MFRRKISLRATLIMYTMLSSDTAKLTNMVYFVIRSWVSFHKNYSNYYIFIMSSNLEGRELSEFATLYIGIFLFGLLGFN